MLNRKDWEFSSILWSIKLFNRNQGINQNEYKIRSFLRILFIYTNNLNLLRTQNFWVRNIIESKIPSGYIATKFDNSHFLFGNQFGFKWSINNFFINLYGQYDLAADYRLPNNTYLFNSRFRNKGIKFSIAKRTDNTQSIFRYQNNEN